MSLEVGESAMLMLRAEGEAECSVSRGSMLSSKGSAASSAAAGKGRGLAPGLSACKQRHQETVIMIDLWDPSRGWR